MPALTIAEMLAVEEAAIQSGQSPRDLLHEAGSQLGHAIARMFPRHKIAAGYLGKGHNAGDVLGALKILRDEYGWKTFVRHGFPQEKLVPLTRELSDSLSLPEFCPADFLSTPLLLIDGLLGTGTDGPLRKNLAALVEEMNHLREKRGATIAAIDTPSGVNPDTGEATSSAVVADATWMIGQPKRGLLTGNAAHFTGRLAVVAVPSLSTSQTTATDLICPQSARFSFPPRSFDFHKGMAGRVAILAGSVRYPGAAVLTAAGALHAGAGLITLHVPMQARDLISSRLPPEIMLRTWEKPTDLLDEKFDSLVVGPGLGEIGVADKFLLDLLEKNKTPTVVDADALNIIARHQAFSLFQAHHILTPHPGEFRRLHPHADAPSREDSARDFISKGKAVLLLKGARTIVTQRDVPTLWANSTGTPAMATGGHGDLLAGVIGALLGGGTKPFDAACFGAWLCGHAAELAADESGALVVTPTETVRFLGRAFSHWRTAAR